MIITVICLGSCYGDKGKIKPGTEGMTYPTSFGSVKISMENDTELLIVILIKNHEYFCLETGGAMKNFVRLTAGGREYNYTNLSPSLIILNHVSGGQYILSEIPEKMELTYSLNQGDKEFSCYVCDDVINFEIK